ncbi:MAG: hypothetical protein V4459_09475 [Pseudomonadota bacterium]
MSGAAALPLLAQTDFDGATAERFSQAFLAHHAGYQLVRPALLPLVVPRALALSMWRTTAGVLADLRRVPECRFGSDATAWIRALGYPEAEVPWLAGMTDRRSIDIATSCARADFVIGARGPRLVEINVGPTIGGIGILDRYAEVFDAFCDTRAVSLPRPCLAWSRMLRTFARARRPLRVALVVADDETDIPHPYEAARFLRQAGIAADVVGVDAVRFDGASAATPTGPVDIVYGCFTFDQLREPLYRRFADRAAACRAAGGPTYFSPPAFTLFGNKAMLMQLRNAPMLAATRALNAATRAFALGNRAGQVLKPAIGYGGDGVVIGPDCSPALWRAAVERALDSRQPHVLQDYVEPVAIRIPSPEGEADYHVGIGCLAFGGRFGGFFLRQTPAAMHGIANCKQGATFAAAGVADDAWFARESARRVDQLRPASVTA